MTARMPKKAASKRLALVHPLLAPLADALAQDKAVERFNANSLRTRGKVFAMVVKERLVLRLPGERGAELVAAGDADYLVMGRRAMKEWLSLAPSAAAQHVALAKEAKAFAASK